MLIYASFTKGFILLHTRLPLNDFFFFFFFVAGAPRGGYFFSSLVEVGASSVAWGVDPDVADLKKVITDRK